MTTPINSLVQILENDFEDFCDDLYLEDTAESGKMWKNRKYNICFPHDGGLSREELIQRYFARIDNFHKIVLNSENLCFVMTIFDRNYTNSALNSIYNSLQKLRQGREFDFCVVCLADKEAPPPLRIVIAACLGQFVIRNLRLTILENSQKNGHKWIT